MRKAIVMTVCQRPFYLEPVLKAWQKVRGVEEWPFYFFVEPTYTKPAMLQKITEFDHPNKIVIQNPKKNGVLTNPWVALNSAFCGPGEPYDFAVLAEEDLQPSDNILEYFDWASDEFEANESVLAACANGTGSDPSTARLEKHFEVWLWGTWRNRWTEHLRDTWDHDYTSGHGFDSLQSGWDWNIDLRLVQQSPDKMCVYPRAALVDNLGQWLGVHADPDDYEDSRPVGFKPHWPQSNFALKEN